MIGRKHLVALAVGIAYLLPAGAAHAQSLKSPKSGDPQVKSIEAISFGPNGLLLIGDGKGRQVVAVDTQDTAPKKLSKTEIPNIADELAGRIGTTGKGIEIIKLAVNPASQTAYFAIRKMDDKKDLLLTLNADGKVREFTLDNVKHVRVPLPTDVKVVKITDITWAGDRVLVAVQASDTFASKFVSIMAPLAGDTRCDCVSAETYHVAHSNWETRAPIRTAIPYEENGKKYLVGAFTCTPIVKYSLDDLKSGGKVKGQSIIEIGSGNEPRDMFVYEKKGKKYILMSMNRFHHKRKPVGPSPHWAVRVDFDLLAENEKVNKKALVRVDRNYESVTDRAQVMPDYHGVVHMDRLDDNRALIVRTDDKGRLDLTAVPLP
ncbi:MAG: hypothetical protein FJ271_02260 [Planctomycetes bacterium]|nr:hypothetical protein [Planctomycetota bacterium]